MKTLVKLATAVLLLAALLPMGGCGCGFDCNSDDDDDGDGTATFSLGFSDALPEDLKEVTIKVTGITLRGNGEDIVIDRFTIPELDLENTASFQVDLLNYRGAQQLLVITDLELATGSYSEIDIAITAGDVNESYVRENDDEQKPIVLQGTTYRLPAFELSSGTQGYTVEFELAQSLQYQADSDDYLLSTDGVRVVNSLTSATLSGTVDEDLFDTGACDDKTDPEAGNRLYLYEGMDLPANRLADVFNDSSRTDTPANAIAPFAVGLVFENQVRGIWEYAFGFLPAGDYTLVFACDTEDDDAVDYDGIVIPQPDDQLYELNLSSSESATCNLGEDVTC